MSVATALRRLPPVRALVGSALVVGAAVGVLLAHHAATRPPTTTFVVARRAIPADREVRAADLGTVALDLPAGSPVVRGPLARTLVGRRTTRRLRPLDLIRPDDLQPSRPAPSPVGVVVPVQVEPGRVPRTALVRGAVLDVLATDPDASGTVSAAAGAVVVAVDPVADAPTDGPVRLRLRVADADAAAVLVDASVRSTLTLVVPPARGGGRP